MCAPPLQMSPIPGLDHPPCFPHSEIKQQEVMCCVRVWSKQNLELILLKATINRKPLK